MNYQRKNSNYFVLLCAVVLAGGFMVSCGPDDVNNTGTQNSRLTNFQELKGPYLGQDPPKMQRELFAPGILSDGLFNGMVFFTSDGSEVYFSSGFIRPFYVGIFFHSHLEDGAWTEPVEFPLERDVAFRPVLSPNGKRVLFISSKMEEQLEGETNPVLIYYMDKVNDSWTAPTAIKFGDAFPYSCGQASIASSGNLYFQAGYHIDGDEDIYFSRYENGKYLPPIRLGDSVNGPEHDVHPCIAPDESFLIFDSQRPDGFGDNDLYVCFPDGKGNWTEARNLGRRVNTEGDERRASVSSDGKYLFFESAVPNPASRLPEPPMTLGELRSFLSNAENGGKDSYWVDAAVIEELKPRGDQ